jgi:AraC-like DNA-binding protein
MPDEEDILDRELATLWRVSYFGRERNPTGSAHWLENRDRDQRTVVFQYCGAGLIHFRDEHRVIHPVNAGQAMLFMHGEETAYGQPRGMTQPFTTEYVTLTGAGLREHWAILRHQGSVIQLDAKGPILPALRRLIDLAGSHSRGDPATMAEEVQAFVLLLLRQMRQAQDHRQSPVERAVDDLMRHPTAPWSLKEVAQRHAVSREHLTRSFHKRLGVAPGIYLAQARLAKALTLLRETAVPMAEVARQAGYSSTLTLNRQVHAATGLSPSRLRQKR